MPSWISQWLDQEGCKEVKLVDRVLSPADAGLIDAYWRAANYISVGEIYLLDNPLLKQPLRPEHVKPRLLGHWVRHRD